MVEATPFAQPKNEDDIVVPVPPDRTSPLDEPPVVEPEPPLPIGMFIVTEEEILLAQQDMNAEQAKKDELTAATAAIANFQAKIYELESRIQALETH